MSHFTVMVINTDGIDDINEQLAPYDENIDVAPYDKGAVSAHEIETFREHYQDKYPKDIPITLDQIVEDYSEDWSGRKWVKVGNEFHEFSTYNPNSKWDWYQIGGRWCGFLKLKEEVEEKKINPSLIMGMTEGGRSALADKIKEHVADQATKEEIDWEKMMKQGGDRAGREYDFVAEEIGTDKDGKILQPKNSWKSYVNRVNSGEISIKQARAWYGSQKIVKLFDKLTSFDNRENIPEDIYFSWNANISEYDFTRQEFVQMGRNNSISTYAVLKDGVWYAKGEMGWWGMSSETDEEAKQWSKGFYETFIKDLPDHALITIVDCHI